MDQQAQSAKELQQNRVWLAVDEVYRQSEDIQRYLAMEQDTSRSLRREAVCGNLDLRF